MKKHEGTSPGALVVWMGVVTLVVVVVVVVARARATEAEVASYHTALPDRPGHALTEPRFERVATTSIPVALPSILMRCPSMSRGGDLLCQKPSTTETSWAVISSEKGKPQWGRMEMLYPEDGESYLGVNHSISSDGQTLFTVVNVGGTTRFIFWYRKPPAGTWTRLHHIDKNGGVTSAYCEFARDSDNWICASTDNHIFFFHRRDSQAGARWEETPGITREPSAYAFRVPVPHFRKCHLMIGQISGQTIVYERPTTQSPWNDGYTLPLPNDISLTPIGASGWPGALNSTGTRAIVTVYQLNDDFELQPPPQDTGYLTEYTRQPDGTWKQWGASLHLGLTLSRATFDLSLATTPDLRLVWVYSAQTGNVADAEQQLGEILVMWRASVNEPLKQVQKLGPPTDTVNTDFVGFRVSPDGQYGYLREDDRSGALVYRLHLYQNKNHSSWGHSG